MTTDVTLCSNALVMLGDSPIAALSESQAASNLYISAYEDALTSSAWRFNTGKAQLSRLTATPRNEWQYAYQLPSDYLTAQRVYPSSDYEIFEDKIYSNQATLDLDYRYKVSEGALPAYFVQYMQIKLAAIFAIPVTDSATKAEYYEKLARDKLAEAAASDAKARPNKSIQSSPFTQVR